jgi:hypothetical protein
MGLLDLIKNLKKRNRVEDWEKDLLLHTFGQLPSEYVVYKKQIEEGLIASVILSDNPRPNYVNFTFDPKVSKKYEKDDGRFFRLENIKVYDDVSEAWNDLEVYITHGLVCGYALTKAVKTKPTFTEVVADDFKQKYLDDFELQLMRTFLSNVEIELINPSDFYEIDLEGRTYYHIRDLEDGDFIGIDEDKNVYQITHDPFEIRRLEGDISKNLPKQ